MLAIAAVVAAGLLFWGSWKFMISNNNVVENYTARHVPPRHQIEHVFPVGGVVLDGVYHSSAAERESKRHPLTTLKRCTASLPMAGTITSTTLRISSKV